LRSASPAETPAQGLYSLQPPNDKSPHPSVESDRGPKATGRRHRTKNNDAGPFPAADPGEDIMRKAALAVLAVSSLMLTAEARAQGAPPAYGEPITIDQAKKVAGAAAAEAKKNNWFMAITIVGPYGDLIYFEKMDNTQHASTAISQHKARAAATFRRPTKAFEDRIAQGGAGLTALTLDGVIASEGGVPIMIGGKIVGAIGTSGATGAQDGQVAMAGINALK
jgi:glc operon protein GlcG